MYMTMRYAMKDSKFEHTALLFAGATFFLSTESESESEESELELGAAAFFVLFLPLDLTSFYAEYEPR